MRQPGAAAKIAASRGFRGRLADNERWLWRLMLAPAILYIILLVGFPFFLSLYYSVSDVTVGSREMNFVGLESFRRVIDNRTFWTALKNTR
jgi:multiple sugar transport system permease protein